MDHLNSDELKLKVEKARKLVKVGGKYRHYKGSEYEVVDVVLHSETFEEMVLYRPLYETGANLWVRPLKLFLSEVEVNGKKVKRFELMDDQLRDSGHGQNDKSEIF